MSDQTESKVVPIREYQDQVDTESKLLAHFESVQSELSIIDSIEDAVKLRDKAELLRVLATKIKASKSTLDEIAAVKVRAERRLGQLLSQRPETRGGDRRSEDFQKSSPSTFENEESPTLSNLGVSKNLSSRSQLIANIPDELFEERIEHTKGLESGRDLSAEILSYAKYLRREQDREERRQEAAEAAERIEPDERIKILHGDFREVLADVPDKSVDMILTDPAYIKKDGTYLDLWKDLSEVAARLLKPATGVLVCYSGNFCLPEALNALSKHLQYLWTGAVLYEKFPDTIHRLRFKTYFKPLLIYCSRDAEYQPHQTQFWFKDIIEGNGYRGLKDHHRWEQGVSESIQILESLSYENDLVVDPFLGSGTVAVACKRMKRRFVGCDVDQDSVNITLTRLAEEPEPS
ncbi:DNA-methyltransferase [Thermodesulfobacteriota bacterium]